MIAPIYINGEIGEGGTTLVDVVAAVQRNPNADEYRVFINSQGGVCDTGYAIHDYLKSLKGKKITTVANGMCASIATVIFLAGEERLISPTAQFMIHSPWGDGIKGNANELEFASMIMRDEENKLVKFYASKTNISNEGITSLLQQTTYMKADEAISLGFATGYAEPIQAVAKIKPNQLIMNLENKINKLLSFFGKHMNSGSMTTADGKLLTVEYPDGVEDGTIEAGDMVSIDGVPASGDIVMADGSTLKVEAGKVIELVPNATAQADEPAPNDGDVALKAELETTKAELQALKAEKEVIGERLALLETAIEKSKSKFVPMAKAPFESKQTDEPVKNAFASAMEGRKQKK